MGLQALDFKLQGLRVGDGELLALAQRNEVGLQGVLALLQELVLLLEPCMSSVHLRELACRFLELDFVADQLGLLLAAAEREDLCRAGVLLGTQELRDLELLEGEALLVLVDLPPLALALELEPGGPLLQVSYGFVHEAELLRLAADGSSGSLLEELEVLTSYPLLLQVLAELGPLFL